MEGDKEMDEEEQEKRSQKDPHVWPLKVAERVSKERKRKTSTFIHLPPLYPLHGHRTWIHFIQDFFKTYCSYYC